MFQNRSLLVIAVKAIEALLQLHGTFSIYILAWWDLVPHYNPMSSPLKKTSRRPSKSSQFHMKWEKPGCYDMVRAGLLWGSPDTPRTTEIAMHRLPAGRHVSHRHVLCRLDKLVDKMQNCGSHYTTGTRTRRLMSNVQCIHVLKVLLCKIFLGSHCWCLSAFLAQLLLLESNAAFPHPSIKIFDCKRERS